MLRSRQIPPTTPDGKDWSVLCGLRGWTVRTEPCAQPTARAVAHAPPKEAKRQNTNTAKQPTTNRSPSGTGKSRVPNSGHTETFGSGFDSLPLHPTETDPRHCPPRPVVQTCTSQAPHPSTPRAPGMRRPSRPTAIPPSTRLTPPEGRISAGQRTNDPPVQTPSKACL
jgi:hypothetical protein